MSDTPRTKELLDGISIDRYGRPLVATLQVCLELELENSRLRDELAETERKYLDAWRESQIERALETEAQHAFASAQAETERLKVEVAHATQAAHDLAVAVAEQRERADSLARELEKKTAALRSLRQPERRRKCGEYCDMCAIGRYEQCRYLSAPEREGWVSVPKEPAEWLYDPREFDEKLFDLCRADNYYGLYDEFLRRAALRAALQYEEK